MEVAQEAHQAALTTFQTKRKGGMCESLNGAPLTVEFVEALKQKGKKKNQ